MKHETITDQPEATFDLASSLAEQLTGRALILLEGNLGAGKTIFAKGIAAGLGIDPSEITSPTFTLINEYYGRLRLVHIDLYRLPISEDNVRLLGLDELFEENAVVVIEWPDRLASYPLPQHYRIKLEIISDNQRKVTIDGPSKV
ncbi:MAG: tRNA (adenosine(37)-N6)-threonylcarbamoyltransferase complex ATPase subunit type 1 TsaE [Acidobacteriota bacterium]|nr:tRNA (adenosine(37)-N6)-threonylcarbamoyltransferase complex ATPase subunit type 1 TsaE [Blastocatellia bacterium]MDW8411191.1 tRNA (adenosine(37)-N6)-threonylcarbamoyltransferase complex ATPase subunit type 1 TsaE [Acidobacteriota bacterium]